MPKTVVRFPSQVKTDPKDRRLYVTCTCGTRSYLGVYGAAHVGTYELTSVCAHCGNDLKITRGGRAQRA